MNITYEFCAYKFLELWERTEKHLHADISKTPSPAKIREALNYFRVARTFKGLSDRKVERISEELLEVSDGCTGSDSTKVILLASRFKEDEENFGSFNLSAASKLLWLRTRSPYLYDSRAVNALRCFGKNFKDYVSYCEAWREEYEKRSDEISLAAHGLVDVPRRYTAGSELEDNELIEIVHSKWFIERVFDIYLWEVGAKKQNKLLVVKAE